MSDFDRDLPLSAFAIYKLKKTTNPKNKKRKNDNHVINMKIKKNKREAPQLLESGSEEEIPTLIPIQPSDLEHNTEQIHIQDIKRCAQVEEVANDIESTNEENVKELLVYKQKTHKNKNSHIIKGLNVKKLHIQEIKNCSQVQDEINNIESTSDHKVEEALIDKRKTDKKRNSDNLQPAVRENPAVEPLKLFKWLIAPIIPKSFFGDYWEAKPLHISRNKPAYYKHLFDSAKLDAMFREESLYYTRNVDVVCYENGVKNVFNPEGKAVTSALWDYYSNGCSIRVLNPQTYNKKIHLLIATLQEYFGSMVGTNIYLTPPDSQGFAPHYDDIEAFVIQLEGRKHWKLYQPTGSDVLARFSSPNLTHSNIGEPFMKVTLEAGDLLYFPRGTIHEGSTDGDAHSLHITVSVYQRTSYADLLEHLLPQALRNAAQNSEEFRRALPLNYLKNVGCVNANNEAPERLKITQAVEKLVQSLVNYLDVDNAADQLGRKFMRDSMPPIPSVNELMNCVKGGDPVLVNGKVFNNDEFSLDTRVRLLRYYCIRLVRNPDEPPKLYYNTENACVYHGEEEQWLELKESMVNLIVKLQTMYPKYLKVEELAGTRSTKRLQLLATMWERGLLVTKHPKGIMS